MNLRFIGLRAKYLFKFVLLNLCYDELNIDFLHAHNFYLLIYLIYYYPVILKVLIVPFFQGLMPGQYKLFLLKIYKMQSSITAVPCFNELNQEIVLM